MGDPYSVQGDRLLEVHHETHVHQGRIYERHCKGRNQSYKSRDGGRAGYRPARHSGGCGSRGPIRQGSI